ncbi:MAG: glycoside hydrolase family 20 zincin-like fold domain-containing protein, partial [Gemmatimonadota bacterium]|nr:glycoside hydrolase family 20 zincin-like fold domain-containing protein [Gemmatimonadota bacterium]
MRVRTAEIMPTPKEIDLSEEQVVTVDHGWFVAKLEKPIYADDAGLVDVGTKFAEAFCVGVGDEPNRIHLQRDRTMRDEEYALEIEPGEITVTAANRAGFMHALATIDHLRAGPLLPVGTVRDHPRLPIRGLHVMVEKIHQLRAESILSLMRSAARHKLNTLLLELGDRFPFEGEYAVAAAPNALSRPELRRIIDEAR